MKKENFYYSKEIKRKIQLWIAAWNNANKALIAIKKKELSSYNYQENLPIIDDMLQWAVKNSKIKYTSGLIEQQRLFTKLMKKDKNNTI